ncbi:MAG: glutathione S-transferase family protein [Kiloniellales bacterium]
MQGPYRLYGGAWSRASGTNMVLEELGLDYEEVPVDVRGGGLKDPAFLEINPAGFLPALTTPEGEHLHESAAIMLYLAERHALGSLVPAPDDPDRGRFLSLYFFLSNDIQPPSKRFFFPHRYALRKEDIAETRQRARAAAEERWGVLDAMLAKRGPWHLGERFSVADIQAAMWAAYGFEEVDDIVSTFPAVRRVFEGVMARPKSRACLLRQRQSLADLRAGR